jgi:hypothetical protein
MVTSPPPAEHQSPKEHEILYDASVLQADDNFGHPSEAETLGYAN